MEENTSKDDLSAGFQDGRGDDNSLYKGWNFGNRWA